MTRNLINGQAIVFVDENRVEHDALVTCLHGGRSWDDEKPFGGTYGEPSFNVPPCINIVYVLKDDKRTDQYGHQLRHASSVVHESQSQAGGYMWKLK